jgi:hypothetical protein
MTVEVEGDHLLRLTGASESWCAGGHSAICVPSIFLVIRRFAAPGSLPLSSCFRTLCSCPTSAVT